MKNNRKAISCLLLEDDPVLQEGIKKILNEQYPDMTVLLTENLKEAALMFYKYQPQLLLFDINLPDGNSFELLEDFYKNREKGFKVIFITAHAHYAIDAFKYSALDFLLKPFLPSQLCETINKVMQQLEEEAYFSKLESFFRNTKETALKEEKKIVLKTQDAIHVVKLSDIFYLQADNNYTVFYLADGESVLVAQSLKKFEESLSSAGFLRVHQSYLVNLSCVRTFKKTQDYLLLGNNEKIPVSGRKRSQVLAYFDTL